MQQPAAKDIMNLNDGVGSLSGKTIFAVLIWLVVWVMLDRGTRLSKMSFEKATALAAPNGTGSHLCDASNHR